MGVAVPIEINKENNLKMNDLEDYLISLVGENGLHVATLSAMAENFKEFVFYVKDGLAYEDMHNQVKVAFPAFEIQM